MADTDDMLSDLLAKNAALFAAYGEWSAGQIMLLAGTADDPNSFDKDGGKTGALGYYPVVNVSGQTIYVPCIARLKEIALGGANAETLAEVLGTANTKLALVDQALDATAGAIGDAAAKAAYAGSQGDYAKQQALLIGDISAAVAATGSAQQAAEEAALAAAAAGKATGALIYAAPSGVVVPGFPNPIVLIELDGNMRPVSLRDANNREWFYDAGGALSAKIAPDDLVIKYHPAGVMVPGFARSVIEITLDPSGRPIGLRDVTNKEWYYDASGALLPVVTQADLSVKTYPTGILVPGCPVPVVGATMFGDGRVTELLGQNGKPYLLDDDGKYYVPSNGKADYDIVIYGSSLGGLMALSRAGYRRGKRVCIIEPYPNYGGSHAAGLSYVDQSTAANAENVIMGGDTNNVYFAQIIALDGSSTHKYVFEPKTAEKVAQNLIAAYAARAIRNSPINGRRDVIVENGLIGPRVKGIWTESGLVTGKVFIDASYEGDLMAAVLGPSGYTWGREAQSVYGEAYAGFQPPTVYSSLGSAFQFYSGTGTPVLGYPFIADPQETVGQGGPKVQSYCFRLPMTRAPLNRVPFEKPYGYDPALYTTTLQIYAAGGKKTFCRDASGQSLGWQGNLANQKVMWNGADLYNGNQKYPTGNWTVRNRIADEHNLYQQGLFWCIANDPIARLYGLGALQDDANDVAGGGVNAIGLCADEFEGSRFGHGWPWWLYPRETIRLKAVYTMTAADMLPGGNVTKATSIGKWAYKWDVHAIQAYIPNNPATGAPYTDRLMMEGSPANADSSTAVYQIPAECMFPPKSACTNLIVPVCAGLSHVAWAPDRLEIVYGFRGEAAGELAAWLCDNPGKAVQDYSYAQLSAALTQFGSKL